MLAGLADIAFRSGPCEFKFGGRLGAQLADLLCGGVVEGGDLVLGFFQAVDLLGEAGFGGGDALVGGGAGRVDLGFGGLGVGGGAQLGDGAGEGVGVLGGELLQLADEFGGAGQADGDGLAAGLLGSLPGGVGFPLAALAMGVERVVAGVVAVLRLRAAVGSACGYALVASGVGALLGDGLAHAAIIFHSIALCKVYAVKC